MLIRAINKITECAPKKLRFRELADIDTIMIHRISVGKNAQEIADWFYTDPESPIRSCMPYSLVFLPDGSVEQALPFTVVSPHALKWNKRALACGIVGDFTKNHAKAQQLEMVRKVCGFLCDAFSASVNLVGHTEVPDSTSDPYKKCPGKHLDPADIRALIVHDKRRIARLALARMGFELGENYHARVA